MVKQKQAVGARKVPGNAPGSSRSPRKAGGTRVEFQKDAVEVNVSDTGSETCSSSEEEEVGVNWWTAGKKGKRSKKVTYVCKGGENDCGKTITHKESSIMCEACGEWYHANCQGLCKGAFEALDKYDLFWICIGCKARLTDTLNLGKRFVTGIAEAEKNIVQRVNQVRTQITADLEEKLESSLKKMEGKVSKQMNENSDALKKTVKAQELESRTDRSRNLILCNVPEVDSEDMQQRKEHDANQLKDIVKVLVGDVQCKVEKLFRLGKKTEQAAGDTEGAEDGRIIDRRPRLLLVKFEKKEDADLLYQNRFSLKDKGYPSTYINRDLSLDERKRQKELRDELARKGRDTHKIVGGKVVPKN